MNTLQVYDPPLCCSSGVCGPEVDPVLVRFAADLRWLAEQGVRVERFNLAQTPGAFADNATVCAALTQKGDTALPLLLVDGKVAASGGYPTRSELAGLLGLPAVSAERFTAVAKPGALAPKASGCCGGAGSAPAAPGSRCCG
jgi:hypothetical protein